VEWHRVSINRCKVLSPAEIVKRPCHQSLECSKEEQGIERRAERAYQVACGGAATYGRSLRMDSVARRGGMAAAAEVLTRLSHRQLAGSTRETEVVSAMLARRCAGAGAVSCVMARLR
jgi:hypothetical protein